MSTQYSCGMTWWTYVEGVADTSRQRDIAERTGIDETNVTRWKKGQVPGPAMVAQFARAYGQPVLKAFMEAGFLTAEEAGERPTAAPSLDSLTDDELLDEIRQRLATKGASNDAPQEPGQEAGSASEQPEAAIAEQETREWAERERAKANARLPRNNPATGQRKRRPSGSKMSDGDGTTTEGKRA